MRSIWKGSLSFGLVSIPIKVVSATESHGVSFRQVHTADGGRIRYRKVCELDEQEVSGDEIGKAYETSDGTRIQLTDEELAALPLPTAKTVEILAFVPAEEIDPIRLDRSYYLTADGQSAGKPYVLLREALVRSGKVAVAKLALRGRESLSMVRVYEDTLVLHTMLWPDEIRPARGMAPGDEVGVRDAELDLADTLMETLGALDMEDLHDEYREAVEALVAAKEEGVPLPGAGEEAARAPGRVVDLMSVLENSVRAARRSRGEEDDEPESGGAQVRELRGRRTGSGGEGGSGTAKKAAKKGEREPAKTSGKAATKKAATKETAKKAERKPAGSGRKATEAGERSASGRTAGAKGGAGKAASSKATTAKRTPRKSA